MENIGDKDYKLDPAVASKSLKIIYLENWDEETKNLDTQNHKHAHIKPSHKKHAKKYSTKFV